MAQRQAGFQTFSGDSNALAARAVEELVGFVIVEELFGHGIPTQIVAELAADVAEVKDRRGAVTDVGDGELAGVDAVELDVDVGDGVRRAVGELHVLDQFLRIGMHAASADFDLPFFADEDRSTDRAGAQFQPCAVGERERRATGGGRRQSCQPRSSEEKSATPDIIAGRSVQQ